MSQMDRRNAAARIEDTAWTSVLREDTIRMANELAEKVDAIRDAGTTVYPPRENVFRALALTPPEKVSCVIVGQDPYFNENQACGLSFSVPAGVKIPPSLRNIFKELVADIGCSMPTSGDLTPWTERGVLLLNSSLTVEAGKPNSHAKMGWDNVTRDILQACFRLPQPVVFMTWGGFARAAVAGLMFAAGGNKLNIYSSHPSPLGATKGNEAVPSFLGSRPFSTANAFLQKNGAAPVNWELP